jgi:hypothetical protein
MKLVLILFLSIKLLFAFELIRKYDATVGLYGNIGQGVVKELHDKNNYSIKFTAKPTSFISDLSGINSIEYKSIGSINAQGLFVPHSFVTIILEDNKKEKTSYIYNHVEKYILKKVHTEEQVKDETVEALIFGNTEKKHIKITDKSKKIKYVPDDYLTLIKNVNFLQKGDIAYLDQNSTDSLHLLSVQKNLFKIKIATKENKYFLELQNDIYGLVKAKTLKSLEIGDANLKAIKMKIVFK